MNSDDIEFCQRAVAYLKPALPVNEPAIELPEQDTPVLTSLGNGLLISYVVDTGNSFEYVSERRRASAGLSEEELKQIAVSNLDTLEKDSEAKVVPYEDVFAVLWDGNFEASLILLGNFWDNYYASLAPNGFVAALPARDVLSFCDASSGTGIQQLRDVVARSSGADHPITNALFHRKSGSLVWELYSN